MKVKTIQILGVALAACAGLVAVQAAEKKDMSTKTAEHSVVTNDNGSISRTFVENTVTTNGNLVTERRRETRTEMDTAGNVIGTTTSEYSQSYGVGDSGWKLPAGKQLAAPDSDKPVATDAFLGLKFGEVFKLDEKTAVREDGEPSLLRATFKPAKALAGFDDYYVYVTPKTHKIARVCACAKNAIEPGGSWRRHYLLEALEKRYRTWPRLCSVFYPYYAFDVAPDRVVTACLRGASSSYETVLSAWDAKMLRLADDERDQLCHEARKAAANRREQQVKDAATAF